MADETARPISMADHDAWLFDLDGVITGTARVHGAAWKRMFDDYLREVADRRGTDFEPFEDEDYVEYVDGKPRYDGVDSFLRSRGIELPWGDPGDPPEAETVCGLGNRKNAFFHEALAAEEVEVFDSSVELVERLKDAGKGVALVTSSKNGEAILDAAGLSDLFETKVDGNVAAERGLVGKPDPNTYEEAARMLGVPVDRAVVVEDAISGVQAGRAGGFGLVVGVARSDDMEALRRNGADVVVGDLGDLDLR